MKVNHLIVSLLCSLFLLVSLSGAGLAQTAVQKSDPTVAGAQNVSGEQIDINQADLQTLATLPGIGPKIAERINEYRENNGPFKSVDDLLNVKGVGPKMLEKIRQLITVS